MILIKLNEECYSRIISDNVISLVRNKMISENEDLMISQAECFEIMNNETKEFVGVISYHYHNDPNYIDYGGNINYRIKEEHRGNGYSKRALILMLEILKRNTKYDQPLYVVSTSYNSNYLKIAIECGGKLIHSGPVPKHVINSFYDKEMKSVDVYRFDIDKIKDKRI